MISDLKQPLLSIVIPTLNRYDTLLPLLRNLMGWESQNFDVIIQDNSTDNATIISFLESNKNEQRFKYYYSSTRLSAIGNCDLAISRATGYYVCFIGDDDGLIPQLIDACAWMLEEKIDSMYCSVGFYTWPGTGHALNVNEQYNGKLVRQSFKGGISYLDPTLELKKIIKSGGQGLFKVPRLYHGVVTKKSLDELYADAATYFPGPVPDMSNAIACNKYIKKHCYIDLPLIISGHSKKSMSGKNSLRLHQGEIKNEKSLPQNTSEEWSQKIPHFWSAPTIWAEAAIRASINTNMENNLKEFNYSMVYANCFAYCDRAYYGRIKETMFKGRNFLDKVGIVFSCLFYFLKISFKRFKILLRKYVSGIDGTHCDNISEAIDRTSELVGPFDSKRKILGV